MWEEDEDNNPYGSFNRRISTASEDGNPTEPPTRTNLPLLFRYRTH